MRAGAVVTIAFPQANGEVKHRPAIVLKHVPPFNDWLCCPVSNQLRHAVPGLDIVINEHDPDYGPMGLRRASVIRVGQLGIIRGNRHARRDRELERYNIRIVSRATNDMAATIFYPGIMFS